jgi:hypothetical protein
VEEDQSANTIGKESDVRNVEEAKSANTIDKEERVRNVIYTAILPKL